VSVTIALTAWVSVLCGPCCMQGDLLVKCKTVIDLPKDDATKEEKVKALRQDINSWVATYRREPKVSGRPSYG
jgi:hypothetical protein